MQICHKSILFVFRAVLDAGNCYTVKRQKKPSVSLAKVKNNCTFSHHSRVLNFFYHFLTMGKTKDMSGHIGYYYAVARGRSPGIYFTWDDCKAQVHGFPNARFKKFGSVGEANEFITLHRTLPPHQSSSSRATVKVQSRTSKVTLAMSQQERRPKAIQKESTATWFRAVTNSFQGQPKRKFSTSPAFDTRKVREERVTNKRLKCSTLPNSNVANLKDFTVDEAGYIVVYTDGACTRNGKFGARAGIGIWFGDKHPLNLSERVRGRQTNNTAEIQAAEKAITQAKRNGIDKLNVKTDSQFVINCITKWIRKWEKNNWTLANGEPVINRSDLEKLDSAMDKMNIKWSYVPGHRGHHGNECADRLAVLGANKQ